MAQGSQDLIEDANCFISLKYLIGTYKARDKLSIKNIFYWLNNGYIYLRQ